MLKANYGHDLARIRRGLWHRRSTEQSVQLGDPCLKTDIGCFVLMHHMGMPKSELASAYTSDEVSNIMGELMNQTVGDFTGKVRRELQTNITQNQPKMQVLNKQVVLSVDTQLDKPELRRVTFYTGKNNIFTWSWPLTAPSSSNCMASKLPTNSTPMLRCASGSTDLQQNARARHRQPKMRC